RAERRERRRCRVRLAAGAQELEPDGAADELGEQSCLACSRLPNELHGATLAKAGRFERLAERRELRISPDERQLGPLLVDSFRDERADRVAGDRLCLALHQELTRLRLVLRTR